MKFIIDRFEGDLAIIELDGEILEIPKDIIPVESKEGDVILVSIDKSETEDRKNRIQEKFNELLSD